MTAPFEGLPHALRSLRVRRKLTQSDLARAIGVSKQRIGDFERGVARPRLDLLDRMLVVLQVDALVLAETLRQVRQGPAVPLRRRCRRPLPGAARPLFHPRAALVAVHHLVQSLAQDLSGALEPGPTHG